MFLTVMQRDSSSQPGRYYRMAALWALLGFLFTSTSPSLSLLTAAGLKVDGPLGIFVCHVQGIAKADPIRDTDAPNSSSSEQEVCCLVCQTAQMASGTVAPQHFTLPTGTALHLASSIIAQTWRSSDVVAFHQPRAPPVVA